jgi:hypothetical protein
MIFSSPPWGGEETLIKLADYVELGNQFSLGGNSFRRQVGITQRFA